MATNSDWKPASREGTLKMAKEWVKEVEKKGEDYWKMDAEEVAEFVETVTTAENEMNIPENLRNAVTNARLRTAFAKLSIAMRDIKKRYFFVPPLTEADIASLGLKMRDNTPTDIGIPTVRPRADIRYPSKGVLEFIISPDGEIGGDKRMYYGCKVVYDVFASGEEEPNDVRQLFESKFTKRKKEQFVFKSADSGKRMFFSFRYENSKGGAGEWSDIFSAVIP